MGHYRHTVNYDCLPIFGQLMSQKMVTLRELQEYYTYEDCLSMYDIIMTDYYNKRTVEMSVDVYRKAQNA